MHTTKTRLQSGAYQLLLQSFTEWLQLLNYSALSLPVHTTSVKDFLRYLEAQGNTPPSSLAQAMPPVLSSTSKQKWVSEQAKPIALAT